MTMTAVETEDVCQINNDPITREPNIANNWLPMHALRYPLDNDILVVFTGHFNGISVEVRSVDEMALLHSMGCFGKGTFSRSRPRPQKSEGIPTIMRKRQFLKRNYWFKKFGALKPSMAGNAFLKELDELTAKIIQDSEAMKNGKKDIIDLVSSEEEMSDGPADTIDDSISQDKGDIVVVVPNSDSEDDDYFANIKPKCCLNKIVLKEKLMLSLQEAFFLIYAYGCLQLITLDNKLIYIQDCWDLFTKTDTDFIPKYVVYHYYKSKGYIVKSGLKFGGDYLLYTMGPEITHADYIVVIKPDKEHFDWISILAHVRMAATAVKDIILAEVIQTKSNLNLPLELNAFTVRETTLDRKIPVTLNEDID